MADPDNFPQVQGVTSIIVRNPAGEVISTITGNPIAAFLETKDLDFDARSALKYIDIIIAEVTEFALLEQVRLQVGVKDRLDDPVDWLDIPFLLSEDAEPLFMRLTARYFRIRIESDSVGVFWRLAALEIFGTVAARRF